MRTRQVLTKGVPGTKAVLSGTVTSVTLPASIMQVVAVGEIEGDVPVSRPIALEVSVGVMVRGAAVAIG
ncbi:MAG: hypothetical protein QW734_07250 [Candidatus Bathyarchaeia archaeon]